MPYLTPDYFSGYYFLRGDFNALFPGLHGNNFLVAKYSKKDAVINKAALFLQGMPGTLAVDSGVRLFEYEISGPHIIWDSEPSNYCSLLSLGCFILNYQYLAMTNLTDSGNELLNFEIGPINNQIFFLESFMVDVSTDSVNVTLKFLSNYEFNFSPMLNYPLETFHGIGRPARWYDVIAKLMASPVPLTSYFVGLANTDVNSDVLNNFNVKDLRIGVTFDYDKKIFANTYNIPSFILKNYLFSCSMDLNGPYNVVPNTVYAFVSPNNINPDLQATQDSIYPYNQYKYLPIGTLSDNMTWVNEFFAWNRSVGFYIGNGTHYEAMIINPYWFLTNQYNSVLNTSNEIVINLDLFVFSVAPNAQSLITFSKQ